MSDLEISQVAGFAVIFLILSGIVGRESADKGRGFFFGFALSFFITPLLAAIVVYLMNAKPAEVRVVK